MPSPFPGMNPYLEQPGIWQDFHETVMPVIRELLIPQLRPKYVSFVNESLYLDVGDDPVFAGRPDLGVVRGPGDRRPTGFATVVEPVTVTLPAAEPVGLSFVEIRDAMGREVVAVIELLSPKNKAGSGRKTYLKKRQRFLASNVNLVEIDLLRAGRRMPMTGLPECSYCVLVSVAGDRPSAKAYPIHLREALPEISIPLRGNDTVRLNLKQAIDLVYDRSDYGSVLYDGEPSPELSSDDAHWAKSLLPRVAER